MPWKGAKEMINMGHYCDEYCFTTTTNVPLGLFRTHLSNSGDADMNENLVVVIKFELVVM